MGHQESLRSRNTSTRMSPSSGSSSSSTPHLLNFRGVTPILTGSCTGGSSFLQERLRERNNERRKSGNFADGSSLGSPIRSAKISDDRRPSSSGLGTKGMGVKQWEEQVSTLHKQNYNLKLELFHRRDRQSKLEAELEAAQKIIEQQAEYQEINDILLLELDRRDQAVDEAINLITGLEEQIELLKEENQRLRQSQEIKNGTSTDSYQSASPHRQKRCSSSGSSKRISQPRPLPRVPSFLSEQSEGTEALRSLYTKFSGPSEQNLSKLDEEEDEISHEAIDSPRLSVLSGLSESSFVSVYGNKHIQEDKLSEQNLEQNSKQLETSIMKWAERAPVASISTSWTPSVHKTQFDSLDKVMNSPLVQNPRQIVIKKERNLVVNTEIQRGLSSGFSRFNDRHVLPPTPDTFCTGKLRADSCNSNETPDYKNEEIAHYVSHPSEVSLPVRPQSACETITSRRDGHGWDTPSETEAGSIIFKEEVTSNQSQPRRIKTPTLFTFNESDWDYDTTYRQASASFYKSHQDRASSESIHNIGRKKSIEDTPKNLPFGDRAQSRSPEPLDEQQSYQKTVKVYTTQVATEKKESVSSVPDTAVSNILPPTWKRNPISLTFARLRRHDSSTNPQSLLVRRKPAIKTQTSPGEEKLSGRNATPPPILRHRDPDPVVRPLSAGSGLILRNEKHRDVIQEKREDGHRRVSSFVSHSIPRQDAQAVEIERDEEYGGGKTVRKWLGIGVGRNNSLRKA